MILIYIMAGICHTWLYCNKQKNYIAQF